MALSRSTICSRQDTKKPPHHWGGFPIIKNSIGLLSLCLFSRSFCCRRCFCCRSFSSRSFSSSRSLLRRTARTSCFLSHLLLSHVLIVVNKLNEAHLSIVTQTVACLNDASVATRTVGNLHRDYLEEFSYSKLVLQVAKNYTTRVCSVVL